MRRFSYAIAAVLLFATVWAPSASAAGCTPSYGGLAAADFDGDGFADLAVQIPDEDVAATSDAGSVQVLYGSSTGLTAVGDQVWSQDSANVEGAAEASDDFGIALAAGDFDGDGYCDLAVGVQGEDVGAVVDAGAVNVLYGSARGLTATEDQLWTQDSEDVLDSAEGSDHFGEVLASGDLDGDGFDDLGIGIPDEDVGAVSGAGAVAILYGSSHGLVEDGNQFINQDSTGIAETAEASDGFGGSLAIANFGKAPQPDLAVGVPAEDVAALADAGAVQVLYSTSAGVTEVDEVWTQDSGGITGTAESSDFFGFSLAAANFGKAAQADLAIGISREDVGATSNAGAIQIIYGSATGLSTVDQLFTQDTPGINEAPESSGDWGKALAAGNLGESSHADLAAGSDCYDLGVSFSGIVHVLYGSTNGITVAGDEVWHQDVAGIQETRESFDLFGSRVAIANFGKSPTPDLAVGAPGEDISASTQSGGVQILYGSPGGVTITDQFWSQDTSGILDSAEDNDGFGGPAGFTVTC